MTEDDIRARNRWIFMQVVRIGGVALLIFGLAVGLGRTGLSPDVGYVLVALGFVAVFAMPVILSKRWKSPPE